MLGHLKRDNLTPGMPTRYVSVRPGVLALSAEADVSAPEKTERPTPTCEI